MPGKSKKGGGLKTKKYKTGAKFGGGAKTAKKITKIPAGFKKSTTRYPSGVKGPNYKVGKRVKR